MGLDMYLFKEIFLGFEFKHRRGEMYRDFPDLSKYSIKRDRISAIVEQAAYWRKANQIHAWFVDNIQDGQDDCRKYYVSPEKLELLLTECKTILKIDRAKWPEILPTREGFFFGGQKYDEYYMEDIQSTIDQLEPLLIEYRNLPKGVYCDFYYQSSW